VLELIARIKANLRKRETAERDIAYKDIIIDISRHRITVGGAEVQATLKEFNLLRLLCEHAGRVREREAIFERVWGEGFVGETRTLDIHIKELRRKLRGAGSAASIKTIRGVGYMLT
jgi:DNA-binding response OmpR family regulator